MNAYDSSVRISRISVLIVPLILISFFSFGQSDLRTLLALAEQNYPAIAAKKAEAEAARASISLERISLLPSLDASYQANYATYNNITGMNYPGHLIPISGPPSDDNYRPVPGSAASLLFKWTPITFGQRSAAITYNEMLYEKNLAGIDNEVLDVKFKVALLYLEIAMTRELIVAWQKNIERNEFNLMQVNSLVSAGLRPGVDSLIFKGELSRTKTRLIELENLLVTQNQKLRELLVSDNLQDLESVVNFFSKLPVYPIQQQETDPPYNPILKMAEFDLKANQARLKLVNRLRFPRLEFWGTTYARGSGIRFDGTVNEAEGWSFSRYNYGVGLQVVFPILDLPKVQLKSDRQEALKRSSENYLRQVQISLNSQEILALNDLSSSLDIVLEVPVEYEANESAYRAIQTRYNSGLVDYTELIQAQYDLLDAETRLKNAYANTWKSLLRLAVIEGDIEIFLKQIQN